ncbi:TerC family protein [Allonocardiopsis opalescens]|uniref:Tellurite resistance protein TerC n=1 Tax=Allonocardiopsis opalescens TaxID=1144618 RepID=A0A2T0PYE7_9ACTN|nr:TerC family protein [Allonocardiopsis opalescens]PRX96489.1 tellurite resistance protein TerC [Allonocardiopsis opalescens]
MDVPFWVWATTIATLLAVICFDFYLIVRNPREPSMRESSIWVSIYVSLAIAFGIGLSFFAGGDQSLDFFTGWIVEYSLSVDNLFVFILILGSFAVPAEHRQRVLLVGIALALIFRGIFIAVGAAAVNAFAWVFFIFGGILLWTAWQLIVSHDDGDEEYKEPAVVSYVRRVMPTTDRYHGAKLTVRLDGKRFATPLLIVMIAVGMTDILFALDSIPAIFGITQEPYLVFTANAFALMGLRQLYFLIGGLLNKLVYLSKGLAIILAFIGVKLVLHAMHTSLHWPVPEIDTLTSLGVIIGVLTVTTVLSLMKARRDEREAAAAAPAADRPGDYPAEVADMDSDTPPGGTSNRFSRDDEAEPSERR